jgi:hypothetical protein
VSGLRQRTAHRLNEKGAGKCGREINGDINERLAPGPEEGLSCQEADQQVIARRSQAWSSAEQGRDIWYERIANLYGHRRTRHRIPKSTNRH